MFDLMQHRADLMRCMGDKLRHAGETTLNLSGAVKTGTMEQLLYSSHAEEKPPPWQHNSVSFLKSWHSACVQGVVFTLRTYICLTAPIQTSTTSSMKSKSWEGRPWTGTVDGSVSYPLVNLRAKLYNLQKYRLNHFTFYHITMTNINACYWYFMV